MLAAALLWSAAMFAAGWVWRGDRAQAARSAEQYKLATGQTKAEQVARQTEQKQAQSVQAAGDIASSREEKINAEYEARLQAALAGRDDELGRLRQQWAASATNCLSNDAATAAASAEQDRLRRASAARIVRATQLAQSERDEVIDRYEAVRTNTLPQD